MAYRSSSTANGSSTSITGTAPAGITAGDRLYAYIVLDTEITNVFPPNLGEWKRISSAHVPNTTTRNGLTSELWEVKSATGAELYTFTASATGNWIIQCVCFSGRSNTESVVTQYDITTTATASPLSVISSGVVATAGADLALFAGLDENASGATWSFTAPASWTERQDVPGTDFTAATIDTIDNVSAGATGSLTITATRTAGTGNANYSVICLSVPALTDATITSQPKRTTVIEGTSATFTVSGTGTGSITYQWQSSNNGIDNWVNISGETGTTLSFTTTRVNQNLFYRVIVTSSLDSITSQVAKLDLILLSYNTQIQRPNRISNTYDYTALGWFHSDLVPKGIFDKDVITLLSNPDVSVSITGQNSNTAVGNITNLLINNITGQQSIISQDSITKELLVNVIGQQNTLTQGDNVAVSNIIPIGQQSSVNQGILNTLVQINTSGQLVTLLEGSVIASSSTGDINVTVTGQSISTEIGIINLLNTLVLSTNQVFATQGNILTAYTVLGNSQLGLLSQGNLNKDFLIYGLGQSGITTLGNITSSLSKELIGELSSLNQGILNTAIQLDAIGQNVIASQGSVSVSIGSNNISVTIVGQEISCSNGITGIISSVFPTGIIASSTEGDTSSNTNINVVGDTINNTLGISTPSNNSLLTGQNISSGQENLLTDTLITVEGQNVNVVQTSVESTNTISLASSEISILQGSVSIALGNDIFVNAVGQEIGLSIGTLVSSIDKQVTGQESTLNQGIIFNSVSVATSTNQLTFTQGNQSVNVSLNGLGQNLTSHQGILTLNIVGLVNERGYSILPENRLFVINLENRLYTILPEDRRYII